MADSPWRDEWQKKEAGDERHGDEQQRFIRECANPAQERSALGIERRPLSVCALGGQAIARRSVDGGSDSGGRSGGSRSARTGHCARGPAGAPGAPEVGGAAGGVAARGAAGDAVAGAAEDPPARAPGGATGGTGEDAAPGAAAGATGRAMGDGFIEMPGAGCAGARTVLGGLAGGGAFAASSRFFSGGRFWYSCHLRRMSPVLSGGIDLSDR